MPLPPFQDSHAHKLKTHLTTLVWAEGCQKPAESQSQLDSLQAFHSPPFEGYRAHAQGMSAHLDEMNKKRAQMRTLNQAVAPSATPSPFFAQSVPIIPKQTLDMPIDPMLTDDYNQQLKDRQQQGQLAQGESQRTRIQRPSWNGGPSLRELAPRPTPAGQYSPAQNGVNGGSPSGQNNRVQQSRVDADRPMYTSRSRRRLNTPVEA